MLRAETNDTIVVDEDCPGAGQCHGCMSWCNRCGDVDRVCEGPRCTVHRCGRCHELRVPDGREDVGGYICRVCEPADHPHRWPTFLVFEYALALADHRPSRAQLLADLETSIERIAYGDESEGEHHPRALARRLGFAGSHW